MGFTYFNPHPEGGNQEHTIIINGPELGAVGRDALNAICDGVRDELIAQYGDILRATRFMITLSEGRPSIEIQTAKISSEKAQEVGQYINLCFDYCAAKILNRTPHPKPDVSKWNEARVYEKIGDAHYANDEYHEAINAYQKALDIYPDEILLMNIGNAYASMGRYDVATQYLEKSLKFNPDYERARKNLETVQGLLRNLNRWK